MGLEWGLHTNKSRLLSIHFWLGGETGKDPVPATPNRKDSESAPNLFRSWDAKITPSTTCFSPSQERGLSRSCFYLHTLVPRGTDLSQGRALLTLTIHVSIVYTQQRDSASDLLSAIPSTGAALGLNKTGRQEPLEFQELNQGGSSVPWSGWTENLVLKHQNPPEGLLAKHPHVATHTGLP